MPRLFSPKHRRLHLFTSDCGSSSAGDHLFRSLDATGVLGESNLLYSFHVTRNSLKHPFDSLISRNFASPMAVPLPYGDPFPHRRHAQHSNTTLSYLFHTRRVSRSLSTTTFTIPMSTPPFHRSRSYPSHCHRQHRSTDPPPICTSDRCLTRGLFALFRLRLWSPNNASSDYVYRTIRPLLFIRQLTSHYLLLINANTSSIHTLHQQH
jgi:hypothetical protein